MSKREPVRHAGFLIHKLPGAGRAKPYQVDLRACPLKDGEAKRPCFATLELAKAKCAEMAHQVKSNGDAAFDLSQRDRLDAKEGLALLSNRCTVAEACRFWVKYHPDNGAVTYSQLLDRYRAHQVAQKVRPATLTGLARLVKAGRTFGNRAVASIMSDELAAWLDGHAFSSVNRNNYRRSLVALFNYGVRENVVSVNPLLRVPVIRVEASPIAFWTADQVALLLHTAEELKPEIVPMLAILAFAGLRPAEAEGLRWESINLKEEVIRVEGATSKTRARRVVPIPKNLADWLVRYRAASGPLALKPQTIRYWRSRIVAATLVPDWRERVSKRENMKGKDMAEAGLSWAKIIKDAKKVRAELWPSDILRHSYATNWLPVFHDENQLAANMGNSPGVIHRHYRGLLSEAEAKPYWSILPATVGLVIPMQAIA